MSVFWLDNVVALAGEPLDLDQAGAGLVVQVQPKWPVLSSTDPSRQELPVFTPAFSRAHWQQWAPLALDVMKLAASGGRSVYLVGEVAELALLYLARERGLTVQRALSQIRVGLPGFDPATLDAHAVQAFLDAMPQSAQHNPLAVPPGMARAMAQPQRVQVPMQMPVRPNVPVGQPAPAVLPAPVVLPPPPGRPGAGLTNPLQAQGGRPLTAADLGMIRPGVDSPDVATGSPPTVTVGATAAPPARPMPAELLPPPPQPANPVEAALRLQAEKGVTVAPQAPPPPVLKPGEVVRMLKVTDETATGREAVK